MALTLRPDLEQRVIGLARETSRNPEDLLAELVGNALEDDGAFRSSVREAIAQLDRGDVVSHEQVMEELRAILGWHATRPTMKLAGCS